MYAAAFRDYGIALTELEPAEAAARIRSSAIRETLLAFLYDWLYWASVADRDLLRALFDRADDDDWRRAYRDVLEVLEDTGQPLRSVDLCRSLGLGVKANATEAMRGVGEGQRPTDLAPNSLMTNATVSGVTAAPQGQVLKVSYKGGEAEVTVGSEHADRYLCSG